jgi:hypothetical protein
MTDWTSIIARIRRVSARNAVLRSFSSHTPSNKPTVAPTGATLHCHTWQLSRRSLHSFIKKHPPTWQIAIQIP